MSEPVESSNIGYKALAIFAVGALLGLGLCRLGGTAVAVGALVFVLSAIGLVITLVIVVIVKLVESFQK